LGVRAVCLFVCLGHFSKRAKAKEQEVVAFFGRLFVYIFLRGVMPPPPPQILQQAHAENFLKANRPTRRKKTTKQKSQCRYFSRFFVAFLGLLSG
jgi:hypothetical protein